MPALLAWLIFIPLTLLCAMPPVRRVFIWLGAKFDRVARYPFGAEGSVFTVALTLGLIPTLFDAVPPPSTHDEFAYLLAADTFMHGRLTNPTHELWEHFETFHQIMRPTYQSKFPAGPGLVLAGAWALVGRPIVGIVVTLALASAAVCWMLRAWAPGRWAFVGGLLAATHPYAYFHWGQTYWGGALAMLGGALVAGAMARALRRGSVGLDVTLGVGLSILALSRPFEGALFATLLCLAMLLLPRRPSLKRILLIARPTALGAVLVLVPALGWLMYYNWRITGSPTTMPYVIHTQQYMASPLFWWQPAPDPPPQRHPKLAHFYQELEHGEYASQTGSAQAFLGGMLLKIRRLLEASLAAPTLATLLVGLPVALWRRRSARVALAACVLLPLVHMLCTPWMRVQYYAPAAPLLVALLVFGARVMVRRRLGAGVVAAVLILQVVAVVVAMVQMVNNPNPTGSARANLVRQLHATPGDHLVIVRYGPGPQSIFEWVYNDADIDRSRIVFARYMDAPSTRRLLEYFRGRRVWLLNVEGVRYDFREYKDLPE